jgi:hypothetical protein
MKRKRKHRLDIDFVAPHALDDCVYRLGRLDDRRAVPFAPPVSIRLAHLDADTWGFCLNEDTPAPIRIDGYLNRLHDDATYVSGRAMMRRRSLYRDLLLGLLLILGLALVVGPVIVLLYLPAFLFFTTRYHDGVADEHARLARLMSDTLVH